MSAGCSTCVSMGLDLNCFTTWRVICDRGLLCTTALGFWLNFIFIYRLTQNTLPLRHRLQQCDKDQRLGCSGFCEMLTWLCCICVALNLNLGDNFRSETTQPRSTNKRVFLRVLYPSLHARTKRSTVMEQHSSAVVIRVNINQTCWSCGSSRVN